MTRKGIYPYQFKDDEQHQKFKKACKIVGYRSMADAFNNKVLEVIKEAEAVDKS